MKDLLNKYSPPQQVAAELVERLAWFSITEWLYGKDPTNWLRRPSEGSLKEWQLLKALATGITL
jgi:hypothetical protein